MTVAVFVMKGTGGGVTMDAILDGTFLDLVDVWREVSQLT